MREQWSKLPKWGRWTLGGIVGLIVLAALVPAEDNKNDTRTTVAANTRVDAQATTEPATQPSQPAPTPEPEVEVVFDGPDTARKDGVVLRGTVEPASAKIRVRGKRATVKGGRWSIPVTLKTGKNSFRVIGTRKGYTKFESTIRVQRKPSAAERAAKRRAAALRRANERACDAAKDYLSFSAFSKQGLFEQLSSSAGSGFTEAEARYAVEHCGGDWKAEAVEAAKNYLEFSSFSRQGLIEQLSSSAGSGFTYEEAVYAVNKVY